MGNLENDTKNCVVWFGAEKKGVNRVDPEQIVLLKKKEDLFARVGVDTAENESSKV